MASTYMDTHEHPWKSKGSILGHAKRKPSSDNLFVLGGGSFFIYLGELRRIHCRKSLVEPRQGNASAESLMKSTFLCQLHHGTAQ